MKATTQERPRKNQRMVHQASDAEMRVGRIAGVFGLHGELKCDPSTAGRNLFTPGRSFRIERADGSSEEKTLISLREHKGRLLVRFDGVEDARAGEAYSGADLFAPRAAIALAPGEYFDCDLTGCAVHDTGGALLGRVTRVEHYPSADMLVIGTSLVPMVSAFIKEIDTASKRITVDLPLGLLDDTQAD